jgi:hypothetical protein
MFHFSFIPLFHGLSDGQDNPSGVKSKSGPLGQDYLLFLRVARSALRATDRSKVIRVPGRSGYALKALIIEMLDDFGCKPKSNT